MSRVNAMIVEQGNMFVFLYSNKITCNKAFFLQYFEHHDL